MARNIKDTAAEARIAQVVESAAQTQAREENRIGLALLNHLGYEISSDGTKWTNLDWRMLDRAQEVIYAEQRVLASGKTLQGIINRAEGKINEGRKTPTRLTVSSIGELQANATIYDAHCAEAATLRESLVSWIPMVNMALGRETKTQGF